MKSGIFSVPGEPKTYPTRTSENRDFGIRSFPEIQKSFHDNWIQLFFRANNAKQVTGTKEMRFVIQRKVQFDETTCNGSALQKICSSPLSELRRELFSFAHSVHANFA